MISGRRGTSRLHRRTKTAAEVGGRRWQGRVRGRQHVAREAEVCPVEEISRGDGVVPHGRPHAQKDEGQMVHPGARARGSSPGHQPFFEGPVLSLDDAITLRVV